jgi:DNA-binding SARP family transcriptional activator/tetratricopeptide (TPR) repeat protein
MLDAVNPNQPPAVAPAPALQLGGAAQARGADGRLQPLADADALLLAWLALEGPTPRERMAAMLWPESSTAQARSALRQRLLRLRRQCGRELVVGQAVLSLATDIDHDLEHATTLLAAVDASAFTGLSTWLLGQRDKCQARVRQDLESRITSLEAEGDAAAALPLAMAWVEHEPLSEAAHRRLMRLHYLRGDRAAALLAFDRLEQLLKDEVGTAPSAPTRDLLRVIESGAAPAAPTDATTWRQELPASVLRPPRLVGRDAELVALQAGWRATRVVLVIGEAGMGKSRLLQAWSAPQEMLPMASCRPGDALVPYASLARLLMRVVNLAPGALDAPLRDRLAPLLPGLSASAPPPPPRRASLLAPVQALMDRLAGMVDGWVLDDLHFADDASLDLLQALLAAPREETTQRWCLGLRPPAPASRLADFVEALSAAGPLVRIPLQPLTTAQVADLLSSLGLQGLDGAALASPLRQRSGGNPLFLLETVKLALAEGGLDLGRELPRPQSLATLIAQQLGRLSPAALMLVRLAAVAGVDFELPLAARVLGQSVLQLADPWAELESQQVLIGTEFAHDLVCEAVLDGIPAVIARHLHGQVAQALEHGSGEPARVAAHWEAAGQRERALPGLRAAAERAHRALREHERIGFLLRAADIAEVTGAPDQAYDCVAQAVETHMNSIRQADGFPLLDRLDRLATTALQTARALGLRAWYCSQLADAEQAIRVGQQALALAIPIGERSLLAQIRQRLGTALATRGRFDEALPHLEAVQSWADRELPSDDLAEFRGNFAVVLDNLGRPDQAWPHHQRALEASAAAGDHAQHATQLANLAVNRLNAGDVAGASARVAQARQLIRSFDLQGSSAGFAAVLEMQCARAQGRYRDAMVLGDEAEALLRASIPARLPVVALHRAHCWLDLGQLARVGPLLEGAASGLPPHFEVRRLLLLARCRHWQGLDTADLLDQAEAAAPANGWPEARMMVAVERAASLPVTQALPMLVEIGGRALTMGLLGLGLSALLQTSVLGAGADDARRALELAGRVEASLRYRGEVWLMAALALRNAGHAAEAAATAHLGATWVRDTAEHQVDAEFRESFLRRNPVNRQLLALASAGA